MPSRFFQARYLKFSRDLSQTRWDCRKCMGKRVLPDGSPCDHCGGTDKYYKISIEDIICPPILHATAGLRALFHAAGREDLDTRCLGPGRPFVVEIEASNIEADIDLEKITKQINDAGNSLIQITPLRLATKSDVVQQKAESAFNCKTYHLLVYCSRCIELAEFSDALRRLQEGLENINIQQRIPTRLINRKGDRSREKQVYRLTGKYIDPVHLFFEIAVQGGTYIKELVSGDAGRTNPSFISILGLDLQCVELDLVNIEPPK